MLRLLDSIIDYPQQDLSGDIWIKKEGQYLLRDEVGRKVLDVLSEYSCFDLTTAKEIRIVGSLTSNQYTDTSDLDVHLIFDEEQLPEEKTVEDWQKDIFKWFKDHRDAIEGYVGDHPIEVYLQLNPAQDFLSPGVYELKSKKWLKEPQLVSADFDPYEVYQNIISDIERVVGPADVLLGRLRRQIVDYDTIKNMLEKMPPDLRQKAKEELQKKLEEIQASIESLLRTKKDWLEMRRFASIPKTPEQALSDIEMMKTWVDKNVLFKFLSRYSYMKTISDLEEIIKDEEVTDKELEIMKSILGVK